MYQGTKNVNVWTKLLEGQIIPIALLFINKCTNGIKICTSA